MTLSDFINLDRSILNLHHLYFHRRFFVVDFFAAEMFNWHNLTLSTSASQCPQSSYFRGNWSRRNVQLAFQGRVHNVFARGCTEADANAWLPLSFGSNIPTICSMGTWNEPLNNMNWPRALLTLLKSDDDTLLECCFNATWSFHIILSFLVTSFKWLKVLKGD